MKDRGRTHPYGCRRNRSEISGIPRSVQCLHPLYDVHTVNTAKELPLKDVLRTPEGNLPPAGKQKSPCAVAAGKAQIVDNGQDCALSPGDPLLQKLECLLLVNGIQVVCRLVQNGNIRILIQKLCEKTRCSSPPESVRTDW